MFLKIPLRPPLLPLTQRNGAKIRLRVPLGSRILATVIVKAYDDNLMMARMGLTVRRIRFVFIFPPYSYGGGLDSRIHLVRVDAVEAKG